MRIRKMLPVLCMALGLTMAAPLAARELYCRRPYQAPPQTHRQPTKQAGTLMLTAPVPTPLTEGPVTGFQWIANSQGTKLLYYFKSGETVFCFSQEARRPHQDRK